MELLGFAIFLIVLALFVIEWRLKKLMQIGREIAADLKRIRNVGKQAESPTDSDWPDFRKFREEEKSG